MPTYRRLASLPALLLTSVLLAACATAPTPAPSSAARSVEPPPTSSPVTSPEPKPSEAIDGVSVSVETLGGHCVQGSCESVITIEPDGRAHQVEPEPKELGTVPHEIMEALVIEVQQADFDAIRSRPFTDTCPIAFDGQQVIYSFWIVTYDERIDSCEVVVDPANPLFVAVDAAIASVVPR